MKKDILIVEDDKAIVRILELELGYEGYSFDIALDGKDGFDKISTNEYGLILLDLMLPEMSGVEICRRVRKFSNIPIIMLTARRDISDKVLGLDLGADDYITKPFETEELLARIRSGIRRGQIINAVNLIEVSDLSVNPTTREVLKSGDSIELSKTEYDLLEYLIMNKGIVLSRDKIVEQVWGYDFDGNTNILDVYIRYLRTKIDYPYKTNLIKTIRGVGYTLKD